jgi:hypothetical protein
MQTVTLTIATNAITVNAAVNTTLAGNIAVFGQLIPVSTWWVVSYGRATTTSGIRSITVSGTVPTVNAESALTPAVATAASLYASGSVVRTICASSSAIVAKPFSGSALTPGTESSQATTAAEYRAFLNGNGNIVCNYRNTTHYATVFKLTTTTEAGSSVSIGTVPTAATTAADYVAVTAGKTAYVYHAGSTAWYSNILTDTAGTATVGTEISGSVSGNLAGVSGLLASGNNARFAIQSASQLQQLTLDCSGTSPTLSSAQVVAYASATATVGIPAASNLYGERSAKQLIAGTVANFIGGPLAVGDTRMGSASIQRQTPLQVISITSGAVGATSAESWLGNIIVSTTGYAIQRVEAAA